MKFFFRIIDKILKGIEIFIEVFIKVTIWGTCLFLVVQAFSFVNWRYNLIDLSVDDIFYVENAELENIDSLGKINEEITKRWGSYENQSAVSMHHIKEGKGVVIGYRWFDDPSLVAQDEEGFKKLSIWLPELPDREKIYNLSETNKIRVVYTSGGSAWPDVSCTSYVTDGTVTLEPEKNRIKVKLVADVNGNAENCDKKSLEMTFDANKIEYKDLTPWLGLKGENIYDETYRPIW